MDAVQTEWNGVQFNYKVNYEELNLRTEFHTGSYVAKMQVPVLHAHAHEMQSATTVGLDSLVLPPQMCDGLREPNVPHPYLVQREASKTQSHYSHYAQPYGSNPNDEKWDPQKGSCLAEMVDFEPVDAWKLGKNDLESMFVDYFRDETDVYKDQLETTLVTTEYEVLHKGFSPDVCKDEYLEHY